MQKFQKLWEKFFLISGSILFLTVLILLLVFDKQVERVMADSVLLLCNLVFLGAIGLLFFLLPYGKLRTVSRPLLTLGVLYFILFLLQIFWVSRTYFYTGWDVSLMRWRIEHILLGGSMQEISADVGYSIYPNNLFLFYVLYLVQKAALLFSVRQPYLVCIYLSCLSVNISCFLGNFVMRRLSGNALIRVLYTVISTLFILFSPWIVIPYSDTFGMFFVVLGLWALICVQRPVFKWPLLAFASIVGYLVKPTCLFPLFAGLLLYLPPLIASIRTKLKELCIIGASVAIFLVTWPLVPIWVQHTFSFELYPELKIPYTHYIMMGMNKDGMGGFNGDDYALSVSIHNYNERKQAIRERINYRLATYTREEKAKLFVDKLLMNFNDGTFAWNGEGAFFDVVFEHDNPINELYKEMFYPDGAFYQIFRTIAQGIWLQILLGLPFAALTGKEHTREKAAVMVVLAGLLVFVMLFEARARYLYLYSPAFLILSLCGYERLFRMIDSCRRMKDCT